MVKTLSTTLPLPLAQQLASAASIDPHVAVGQSAERTRVLNSTITRIKLHYPQFFRFYDIHHVS